MGKYIVCNKKLYCNLNKRIEMPRKKKERKKERKKKPKAAQQEKDCLPFIRMQGRRQQESAEQCEEW